MNTFHDIGDASKPARKRPVRNRPTLAEYAQVLRTANERVAIARHRLGLAVAVIPVTLILGIVIGRLI